MAGFARLITVNSQGNSSDEFIFAFALPNDRTSVTALAPNRMQRNYSAVYAPVPVAYGDQIPEEWKANNPAEITIEFEIVANGTQAVTKKLRDFRKLMKKDRRTGEPPILALCIGVNSWTVRIHRISENPVLWNSDTDEQRVKVTATLHTLDWDD